MRIVVFTSQSIIEFFQKCIEKGVSFALPTEKPTKCSSASGPSAERRTRACTISGIVRNTLQSCELSIMLLDRGHGRGLPCKKHRVVDHLGIWPS